VTEVLVVAGGFLGGFASGLTGFGFGLSSLPIWALVLAPAASAPLVMACSIVAQVQTLPAIWHALDLRRLAPFVLAGVLGVPFGVWLLPYISPRAFRIGLGLLLVVACGSLLVLHAAKRRESSRAADGTIGFLGGVLGGIAGLSGVLPTLWAELHGWGKDERRAIFQGFNFSILLFALVAQAVAGLLTPALVPLLLLAVPASMVGVWLGRSIYNRIDARRFNRIVLWILVAAGVTLVTTSV